MKMKTCVYCLSGICVNRVCNRCAYTHCTQPFDCRTATRAFVHKYLIKIGETFVVHFWPNMHTLFIAFLSFVERFVTHEIHGHVESNRRKLSCTQRATSHYFRCSSNLFLCAFDDTHTLSWAIRISYIVRVIVEFPCRVLFCCCCLKWEYIPSI